MFINARTTLTIHVREKEGNTYAKKWKQFFFKFFFFCFINSSINMICGVFFMHVRLDKYTNINLKLYFFLKCLCISKLDAICYQMTCHLHIRGKKNISVFGRYLILRLITVNYFFNKWTVLTVSYGHKKKDIFPYF